MENVYRIYSADGTWMEHGSKSIQEIIKEILDKMEKKVLQLHQRKTERQQHQTLEKLKYVKPAKDSSSHYVEKPEIIGRRPVYYPIRPNFTFFFFLPLRDLFVDKD